MKVVYENSMQYKMLQRIQSLAGNAVLRADVADLGSARQVSRALKKLAEAGKLAKLGYGVYAKLESSRFSEKPYLKAGFLPVIREALSRLNIPWEPSQAEKEYNMKRSTQVPIFPTTKLNTRLRRKLKYQNMEFKIE